VIEEHMVSDKLTCFLETQDLQDTSGSHLTFLHVTRRIERLNYAESSTVKKPRFRYDRRLFLLMRRTRACYESVPQ